MKKHHNTINQNLFLNGIGVSVPIIMGYFPVSLAFGLAAKSAGFTALGAVTISALIFAGASQFALLSMISCGGSVFFTTLICLALNARHIVYGPTLSSKIKKKETGFPLFLVSFGLTDEVFSTALSQIERLSCEKQIPWIAGLEAGAYLTWVFGTWLGAFSGNIVKTHLPGIESVLSFSLPALFLTLLVLMIKKETILPVLASAAAALLFVRFNLNTFGIIAASFIGPAVWFITRKSP